MRKYFVLLILIIRFYAVTAQMPAIKRDLKLNSFYTAQSDQCMNVILRLKVSAAKSGLLCTITKNEVKLRGNLVKDSQKVNRDTPNLYRFYLSKQSVPLLMIRFYKEDSDYKAMIYNQEYLEIFKPCFDLKGIEMTLNQN